MNLAVVQRFRIAEDVHRVLAHARYKVPGTTLDRLSARLRRDGKKWNLAVSVDGPFYKRPALVAWLGRELEKRKLRIVQESPNTLWLFVVEREFLFCQREYSYWDLPERARHGSGRQGSLPATVGAAVAFRSLRHRPATVFDPVCGTGTLLREVGGFAPSVRTYGTDTDPGAVRAAQQWASGKDNVSIWKADSLLLSDGDVPPVDVFVANLPFGKLYGSKETNATLYAALISKFGQLGKPSSWRAIVVTSDREALEVALTQLPEIDTDTETSIRIRGEVARIVELSPRESVR